jgi:hypothetical protein
MNFNVKEDHINRDKSTVNKSDGPKKKRRKVEELTAGKYRISALSNSKEISHQSAVSSSDPTKPPISSTIESLVYICDICQRSYPSEQVIYSR